MLIGGHVLGYLTGAPRATVDVAVIVSSSHVEKAVKAIKARFPQLTPQDLVYNVRFNNTLRGHVDPERIDVVRADNAFFQRVVERYAVSIQSKGQQVFVPTIEAAIALKFAAAISPNRGGESKPQDRIDLLAIVRKNGQLNWPSWRSWATSSTQAAAWSYGISCAMCRPARASCSRAVSPWRVRRDVPCFDGTFRLRCASAQPASPKAGRGSPQSPS